MSKSPNVGSYKKYFVEFIPVEGDLKQGDFYLGIAGILYKIEKGFDVAQAKKDIGEKRFKENFQKVKPSLCSRDIQIRDKISSLLTDCTYFCTATKEHLDSNRRVDNNNEYFKVIGEISPDAAPHVKRGAEFSEEEIKHDYKILDGLWTPVTESIYQNYTGKQEKKHIILLKCPWGCFH